MAATLQISKLLPNRLPSMSSHHCRIFDISDKYHRNFYVKCLQTNRRVWIFINNNVLRLSHYLRKSPWLRNSSSEDVVCQTHIRVHTVVQKLFCIQLYSTQQLKSYLEHCYAIYFKRKENEANIFAMHIIFQNWYIARSWDHHMIGGKLGLTYLA